MQLEGAVVTSNAPLCLATHSPWLYSHLRFTILPCRQNPTSSGDLAQGCANAALQRGSRKKHLQRNAAGSNLHRRNRARRTQRIAQEPRPYRRPPRCFDLRPHQRPLSTHPELLAIRDAYDDVRAVSANQLSNEMSSATLRLIHRSLTFLNANCEFIDLVSRVPGKRYVSYRHESIVARAANAELFRPSESFIDFAWPHLYDGSLDELSMAQLTYTAAMAPCLAMEIFDRNNKKGPATYFEVLIGHIFAKLLGVEASVEERFQFSIAKCLLQWISSTNSTRIAAYIYLSRCPRVNEWCRHGPISAFLMRHSVSDAAWGSWSFAQKRSWIPEP